MRILWLSNPPFANSGYGKVTRNVLNRLKDKHEIEVLCDWGLQGNPIVYNGIKCHPMKIPSEGGTMASAARETLKYLPKLFGKEKFDTSLLFYDIWATNDLLLKLSVPWIAHAPIDSDPMSPLFFDSIHSAKEILTFCNFAKGLLDKMEIPNTLIPHGVDTKLYYPDDNKDKYREMCNIPKDVTVFMICGINRGSRKGIHGMMEAYGRFLAKNPEAKEKTRLYIHSEFTGFDHGFNLVNLAQLFEISESCIFTSPDDYADLSDVRLGDLFRSADVLLQCSQSEGFGLPILEAAACGVPAIVTDYSSMPELVDGHGIKVRVAYKELQARNYNYAGLPYIPDIVKAIETYYNDKNKIKDDGKKAATWAKNNYDYDNKIIPLWDKFFKRYEETHLKKVI